MPSAGGSEAKALHAAAQKALAGEIDARAARLSQAPDEQFVLASDGAVRWMGDVVGKLVAGEDVLHPRVRVIADEHLTGAPRDAGAGAARSLDQGAYREAAWRRCSRSMRPRTSPGSRAAWRSNSSRRSACSSGRRSPRRSRAWISPRARPCANTACASAPITSTYRHCSSRRRACWPLSSGRSSMASPTAKGSMRPAAPRGQRPHVHSGRQGDRQDAVSDGRLSGMRRARGSRRHSRTPGRSDPSGARLAGRRTGSEARRRARGLRFHREPADDVAHRRFRRRLCLDPALARLPCGAPSQTRAGAVSAQPAAEASEAETAAPAEPTQSAATEAMAEANQEPAQSSRRCQPRLCQSRLVPIEMPPTESACDRDTAPAETLPSRDIGSRTSDRVPPDTPVAVEEPAFIEVWRPGRA